MREHFSFDILIIIYTVLPRLSRPRISGTSIIRICAVHHVITVCGHVRTHVVPDFSLEVLFPSPFFLVGSSLTSLGMSSAKCKASPPPAGRGKRKRVMLTISQKLEICDLVTSQRLSYGDIARKYGIGRQTVADIKKRRRTCESFNAESFNAFLLSRQFWLYRHTRKCVCPTLSG